MTPSGGGGVAFGAHIGGFVRRSCADSGVQATQCAAAASGSPRPSSSRPANRAEPARERTFAGEGTIEDRVFSVFPEVAALTERGAPILSGGQRKMVAILRAMSLSPSLLLIDEAFEGLAPLVVNRFREAMVRIREMRIALLMAESNLSHAALVADRLYAIDRGEIIFEGNSEDALASEAIMKTLRG